MDTYPNDRANTHFALKFGRLVVKCCLANEIGPECVNLLFTVALQEDSARYAKAITFWNGQFMPLVGAKCDSTFRRWRDDCVEAGWLHYTPGRKGKAAKYWVVIPSWAEGLDDGPTHETDDEYKPADEPKPAKRKPAKAPESGLQRIIAAIEFVTKNSAATDRSIKRYAKVIQGGGFDADLVLYYGRNFRKIHHYAKDRTDNPSAKEIAKNMGAARDHYEKSRGGDKEKAAFEQWKAKMLKTQREADELGMEVAFKLYARDDQLEQQLTGLDKHLPEVAKLFRNELDRRQADKK